MDGEVDLFSEHGDVLGHGDEYGGDQEDVLESQGSHMSDGGDKLSNTESLASRLSSTGSVASGEVLTDFKREAVNKALAVLNVSPVIKKKNEAEELSQPEVKGNYRCSEK